MTAQAPMGSSRVAARGLAGRSLLIVDDEQDILNALGETVQREFPELRVHLRPSGPSALELLGHDDVDLIITDYRMPVMNGLQFLQEARLVAPRASRLLFTAHPDLTVAVEAIEKAGIEGFFVKPLDVSQFLDTVAATLFERIARQLRSRSQATPLGRVRPESAHHLDSSV